MLKFMEEISNTPDVITMESVIDYYGLDASIITEGVKEIGSKIKEKTSHAWASVKRWIKEMLQKIKDFFAKVTTVDTLYISKRMNDKYTAFVKKCDGINVSQLEAIVSKIYASDKSVDGWDKIAYEYDKKLDEVDAAKKEFLAIRFEAGDSPDVSLKTSSLISQKNILAKHLLSLNKMADKMKLPEESADASEITKKQKQAVAIHKCIQYAMIAIGARQAALTHLWALGNGNRSNAKERILQKWKLNK